MSDNLAITPGSGATAAADDVGGVLYQRIKRSVGADGSATDFLDQKTGTDTYTTTVAGTARDVSAQGMSRFGLQVKQTGTVTSWTVDLQVSLDGTNYVTVMSHTKAGDGDGAIIWTGAEPRPALYFRSNCSALTLGGGGAGTGGLMLTGAGH
jgi:hypothetical protein